MHEVYLDTKQTNNKKLVFSLITNILCITLVYLNLYHILWPINSIEMLTKLRRVKQWEVFARTWWLYDAKWQDPYQSGMLVARYLTGKHKPLWHPETDCGDHVVVINGSQIALPNEEWRWRHFFHNTQFKGGQNWKSAYELHQKDPTFVLERAIYKYAGRGQDRYRSFGRLVLLNGEEIPEDIKSKISSQIRQARRVPRKINEIPREEIENFPKLFDYDWPQLLE